MTMRRARAASGSILLGLLALIGAGACTSPTDCAGASTLGIALTILDPAGNDVSRTTWVVVIRKEPIPPALPDTAEGLHDSENASPLLSTVDRAGRYELHIQRDGFEPVVREVFVREHPGACESVIQEILTVTLAPVAGGAA